jgi:hypothetical protein
MPTTKQIWRQEDRESPMERARRESLTASAALVSMWGIYDALIDTTGYNDVAFYDRVFTSLTSTLTTTRTLLEAYEYFLARCGEAGLSPEQAHTSWQVHSSPAFEAELVHAEEFGPNALGMIDRQILRPMGLQPHDEDDDSESGLEGGSADV